MKKIKVKRLMYSKLGSSEVIYGNEEYDGNLTDDSILSAIHEAGKTEWLPTNWVGPGDRWENELWLLKPDLNNPNVKYPTYRIYVNTFYWYQKSWYNLLWDWIKKII